MPVGAIIGIAMAVMALGVVISMKPVHHPAHAATRHDWKPTVNVPPEHTGATLGFAAELRRAKQDLTDERRYGAVWSYASALNAVEADLSNSLDKLLQSTMDRLGLDARERLAIVVA